MIETESPPGASGASGATGVPPCFRLYIAGTSPNSQRAMDNFKAIIRDFFPDGCELEVVDVLEEPLRALADGILLTPTLVRESPAPARVVGNLSDRETVLLTFGLEAHV